MPDNKNPFNKLYQKAKNNQIKKSAPVKDITGVGASAGMKSTTLDPRFQKIAKEKGWNISSMSDTNMEAQAYLDQTGWEMTKNMASGFGKQAVAGFIDSIAAYDIEDQYNMVAGNTNQKFGNYLTELSKSIRENEQLENPIYQNGDDMFNGAYWMNQAKNQGYTAGIIAEGIAEQFAMSYVTAQTGGANAANQAAVLGSWGVRLNKLKTLRYALQGSVKGVQEAYINALETQEQVYNKYKGLGYTEEKATELAGKAAAIGYKTEVAPAMLMNALQYGAIAKYNPYMKGGVDTGYSGFINKVTEAVIPKMKNKFANGVVSYGMNMVGEGMEEAIQTGIGQYAQYSIDREQGLTGGKTMSDYLMNTEMRDSIIGGVFGGGMFKGMHDIRARISPKARNQNKQEALINEAVDTFMGANSERLTDGYNKIKSAYATGKTHIIEKAKRDFNIDNSLAALHLDHIQGKDIAFNSQVDLMNTVLEAAQNDNKEVLAQHGLTTEEDINNVKETFPLLIEETLRTRETLTKNISRTRSYEVAEKLTKYESAMGIYQNAIQQTEQRRNEIISDPSFTQLNSVQQKIIQTAMEKAAIENNLADDTLSLDEIEKLENELSIKESELKELDNEFETNYPYIAKTHLQYNAQDLLDNTVELRAYNRAYNKTLKDYSDLTNPKAQRKLENKATINKAKQNINKAKEFEDLDLVQQELEDKKLLNRNLKKEINKKRQALKRQEASNINEDTSDSKSILDSVIDKLNNVEVGPKFNKAVSNLKNKLNLPIGSNTPKFVKNLAIAQELLKNRLFNEQVEAINNQFDELEKNNELLGEKINETKEKVAELEQIVNNKKISKEKQKQNIIDTINSLSDEYVYHVHQTDFTAVNNMLENGFTLQGPAMESTFLTMSKETMIKVFTDMVDGITMHRGSTSAYIFAIPKDFYGNTKQVANNSFDALLDNGYMSGELTLPKEFTVGTYSNQNGININDKFIENKESKIISTNEVTEKHIPEEQSLFENEVPKSATVGNNVAPILEAIEEVLEQSPTEKSSSTIVNSSNNNYSQDKSEFIVFKTNEGLNVENNNIFTEESIKNNFKGFIDFRATSEFQQAANQSKQFLINKHTLKDGTNVLEIIKIHPDSFGRTGGTSVIVKEVGESFTDEIIDNLYDNLIGSNNKQTKQETDNFVDQIFTIINSTKIEEVKNELPTEKMQVLFSNLEDNENDFLSPLFVEDSMIPQLGKLVKTLYDKYESENNYKPNFMQFITFAIDNSGYGKTDVEKIYNGLKEGWLYNNYPQADFTNIYDAIFSNTKDIFGEIFNIMNIRATENVEANTNIVNENNTPDRVETIKNKEGKIVEKPNQKVILNSGEQVDRRRIITTSLHALHQSLPASFIKNEDGSLSVIENNKQILNDVGFVQSQKLLDSNIANVGDILSVRVPENFENLPVQIFDDEGNYEKSIPFSNYVIENGLMEDDPGYISNVPMLAYDKDGTPLFQIKSPNWYNKNSYGKENHPEYQTKEIEEARKKLVDFRSNIIKNGPSDISILDKSNGFYNTIPSDMPLRPLDDVLPHGTFLIGDESGDLIDTNGKVIYQAGDKRVNMFKSDKPEKIKSGYTYISVPSANNQTDFVFYLNKTQGVKNPQMKETILKVVENYLTSVENVDNEDANRLMQEVSEKFGIDMSAAKDVDNFLSRFMMPFTRKELFDGKQHKEYASIISNYMDTAKKADGSFMYPDGTFYYATQSGTFYVGRVRNSVNENSESGQKIIYLNPQAGDVDTQKPAYKGLVKSIVKAMDEALDNTFHNINKNALKSNLNGKKVQMFNINESNEVVSTGQTYEEYLRQEALVTNLISYNIGTSDKPNYVVGVQPSITFKALNNLSGQKEFKILEPNGNAFGIANNNATESVSTKTETTMLETIKVVQEENLLEPEVVDIPTVQPTKGNVIFSDTDLMEAEAKFEGEQETKTEVLFDPKEVEPTESNPVEQLSYVGNNVYDTISTQFSLAGIKFNSNKTDIQPTLKSEIADNKTTSIELIEDRLLFRFTEEATSNDIVNTFVQANLYLDSSLIKELKNEIETILDKEVEDVNSEGRNLIAGLASGKNGIRDLVSTEKKLKAAETISSVIFGTNYSNLLNLTDKINVNIEDYNFLGNVKDGKQNELPTEEKSNDVEVTEENKLVEESAIPRQLALDTYKTLKEFGIEDKNPSIQKLKNVLGKSNNDTFSSIDFTDVSLASIRESEKINEHLNHTQENELVDFLYVIANDINTDESFKTKDELKDELKDRLSNLILSKKINIKGLVDQFGKLDSVEDFDNVVSLLLDKLQTLDYILKNNESIIDKASNKFIKLNNIKEKNEEVSKDEDGLDTSNESDEHIQDKNHSKISLEENSKKSASVKLKSFFKLIKDVTKNNQDKSGFLGVQKYLGFDTIWDGIQQVMSTPTEMYSDFNAMLERIEQHIPSKPWLSQVYTSLKNADEQTKNEFTYLFARHLLSMKFVMYSKNRDEGYTLKVYDTNSNDIVRVLQNNWKSNLNASTLLGVNEETGDYQLNVEKAQELLEEFKNFTGLGKSATNEVLINWLEEFGINLSNETLQEIRTKGAYYNGTKLNFSGHFNKKGTTPGIFGLLANYLETALESNNLSIDADSNNHPFNNANNALKTLATIESKYTITSVTNSFRDGDKSIYGYTPSKYATDAVFKLANDENYRAKFRDKAYSKDSMLLKLLDSNENLRDKFGIDHVGITAFKELNKKIFGDNNITNLSSSDHEATKLGFFQDMKQGDIKDTVGDNSTIGMRIARMFLPTMSDKSQMLTLTTAVLNLENKHLYDKVGKTVRPTDEVLNVYYEQVAKNELNRIIDFVSKVGRTNIKDYDFAAQMFLAHPYLNAIEINYKDKDYNILELLESTALMPENLVNNIITEYIEPAIKSKLKESLEKRVENKVNEWKDLGFVSEDKIRIFDSGYLKKFKDGKLSNDEVLKMAAYDYIINNQISLSNTFMLIAGDLANYAKKGVQYPFDGKPWLFKEGYKDNLSNEEKYGELIKGDNLGINLGKRLAILLAPGSKLANSRGLTNDKYTYDSEYIQLFLNDFETITKNFDFLIELYYGKKAREENGHLVEKFFSTTDNEVKNNIVNTLSEKFPEISDYLKIEATDAQEYTTTKEHLDLLFRQGRLSEQDYDTMSEKVNNQYKEEREGKPISKENLLSDNHLKLIMQPIKPVYTGLIEDIENNAMRMMYIKTSSFPLLPQLTAGTELDGLRKTMELAQEKSGKNVRASYASGNKVGSMAKNRALNVLNLDGTFNKDLYENLNQDGVDFKETLVGLGSLVLERDNFRIQQDVPPKFAKRNEDVVSLVTQVMKLLFGDGIMELEGFSFNNSNIDGKKLYEKYNESWFKLLDLKKKSLYDELGLDDNGNPINEEETAVFLRDLLEREAIDRGYPQQDIDALKLQRINSNGEVRYDFTVPLWLSPNSNRYESLLNAIVTNRLTKIKMPGNSYVAGSESGFKMTESLDGVDTSKIIYTNSFKGELTPYKDGNIAQVFLPSRFRNNRGELIEFTYPDGSFNTDYVYKDKNGMLKLIDGKISKELLSLSSFRIPTSSHVSMSQIEIVGILPTEVGDLMIVPQNFGIQKGLDYDVDKENTYHLYTYTKADGSIVPFDEVAKEEIMQEAKEKLLNVKGSSKKQREISDNFFKLMFGEDVNEWSTSEFASNDKKMEALSKKLDEKILKNEIVKIHSSVLSSSNPKVQEKINKVLSMNVAKLSASIINQEVTSSNDGIFSLFDDDYQKEKMELGSSGKLGISVYSNYVVLHSMLKQVTDEGHEIRLLKEFENEDGKISYKPFELNIAGIISDGVLGKDRLRETDRSISEMLAERQNTATDNEKEQIMGKVNINEFTINFDSLMTLLGYDLVNIKSKNKNVSLSYLLLAQPVMKEYVNKLKEAKSTTNETFLKNSENDVYENLYQELYDKLDDVQKGSLGNTYFGNLNGDKLFYNLKNSDPYTQIKTLELFKFINEQAKTLAKVQQSLNTTKGLGKSFFEVIEKRKALMDVYNNRNKIQNIDKLLGNFYKQPIKTNKSVEENKYFVGEGVDEDGNAFDLHLEPTNSVSKMTVSTIDAGYNLWSKYFPYENEIIDFAVKKLSTYKGIGAESPSQLVAVRMQVLQEMKKYLYSNGTFTNLHKGLSASTVRKNIFVDTETNESIATYLNKVTQMRDDDVIYDSLISNRLISRFKYKLEKNGSPSTIIFDNTVGEQFEEEYLYSSIPALIVNNKQLPDRNGQYYDTRMLAVDLITYNYVQGGIQGATEFSKYIPISVLEAVGFAGNTRSFTNPKTLNENFKKAFGNIDDNGYNNFIKQMIQHNPQSVTRVELEELKFNRKYYKDLNSASVVIINNENMSEDLYKYYANQDFISVYNPKIKKGKSKFMLYIQEDKEKNPGVFTRIDVLGGNGISEYQYQNNDVKTIVNDSYSKKINSVTNPVEKKGDTSNIDINKDFYSINSGNLMEVLNNVSKSENIYNSELAKFLSENIDFTGVNISIDNSIESEGVYKESENAVKLNNNIFNDKATAERVILHEAIHKATVQRLSKYIEDLRTDNPKFKVPDNEVPADIKDMLFIYRTSLGLKDQILDKLSTSESRKRGNYALSELAEFITGVMTDKNFQEALKQVKYQKTNLSLYDKFATILVKLFDSIGLSPLIENSLLRDSLLASFELIQQQAIENKTTNTGNEYSSLIERVIELNKELGNKSNVTEDDFESLIPTNVKFEVFGNFPISNDTKKSILNGAKTITIRQEDKNNSSGYYTLANGREFLFSKVENKPINIQNLYDKGYTQEYILNKFGVSSISDINDISVKNWFEGKNEKNVFIIKESKAFFSKQYSQLDINKIPTCK